MASAPRVLFTRSDRALLLCAAWALAAAMAHREGGLIWGCVVCAPAVILCLAHRPGPWVWALPALFAASPTDDTVRWPEPGPVFIEGRVLAPVRVDPLRSSCVFRLERRKQVFDCVVVDAPADFRVLPGDTVRGPARLPRQVERRRTGLPPRVRTTHDALTIDPGPPGLARTTTAARLAAQRTLLALVPGEAGILLTHLTLGQGPQLPETLVQAHRSTGLSHLLAVSGAHLTMVGWLLGLGFVLVRRRSPLGSKWFRRGCATVLVFYGALTGMEPPVFRAVVASLVLLTGSSRGRRVSVTAVLAVPAILTALLSPSELFGASFNLSYAAVFGLALSGATRGSGWSRWLWGPILASLWATLCTTPLTLTYFGRVAPWTILATPLLSPLVATLLGLSLVTAGAAETFPLLSQALAWPLTLLTESYIGAVRTTADLPLAPVFARSLPEPAILGAAAILGLLALVCLANRRGVAALCVCLSLPHFLPPLPSAPGLELLAVGHGQAALLTTTDGSRALIDCGSLADPRRAARTAAEANLPRRSLDWLVLTHPDSDHTAGVAPLLSRVVVHNAIIPIEMRSSPITRSLAAQGCDVQFLDPGAQLRPHPEILVVRPVLGGATSNEESAWVRADLGSFSVVVSGDAEEAGTAAWLTHEASAPVDVLVLPHHGRPHGGIRDLLARMRPRLALVSSAAADGQSAQASLARAAGYRVLHTGVNGTIRIRTGTPPTIEIQRPLVLGVRDSR